MIYMPYVTPVQTQILNFVFIKSFKNSIKSSNKINGSNAVHSMHQNSIRIESSIHN